MPGDLLCKLHRQHLGPLLKAPRLPSRSELPQRPVFIQVPYFLILREFTQTLQKGNREAREIINSSNNERCANTGERRAYL